MKYPIVFWTFHSLVCLQLNKAPRNVISIVGSNISKTYFLNYNCLMIVVEENNISFSIFTNTSLLQYKSYILTFVRETSFPCGYEFLLKSILRQAFEQQCTAFIIQLSQPSCFLKSWKTTSKKSLFRHNPRILFLPTQRNKIISQNIIDCDEVKFINDVAAIDIIPLAERPEKELWFKVVTFGIRLELQTETKCSVNTCENVFEHLFQNRILNFNQRGLQVATFDYAPYAILNELDGTELRIISEYNRIHNCTTIVVTDKAEWGNIYENGTGDGILGSVAEERADLGLAALYLWYHEYQFLDFSIPYIRTGITCLVPKPKQLSKILLPVRPFNPLTWAVVVCFVILTGTTLYFTKKTDISYRAKPHKNDLWITAKENTLFRILGFMLPHTNQGYKAQLSSTRQLVYWFHMMFLLVTTSYNSGLASILAVPSYFPPIDTVSDLVNSKLTWGATHDAWTFSLREATAPEITYLVKKFRALPKELLHYHSLKENFAFSIERLPAGHFAVGDYITEDSMKHLRLMKEDIYYEYCILVFPKGSPYRDSFNILIHKLLESGLLLFWEGEVARKFLNSPVQSAIRDSVMVSRVKPNPIQLSHLQGAFFILALGLILALIIFIMELFSCSKKIIHV